MVEVEIRAFREVDPRDGAVIAAFPSSGLVSTIVASYLISKLDSDPDTLHRLRPFVVQGRRRFTFELSGLSRRD